MTRTLTATATAAVLALTLSACSDDSGEGPETTSTSTTSQDSNESPTATPQDRSDAVFDAYTAPEVLGSASGQVSMGSNSVSAVESVTFAVTHVAATADGTILRYQLTAEDGSAPFGMEGRYWFDQPTLHVPGSDAQLQTVTASLPAGERQGAQERCVCTSIRFAGPDPRSQTALYPALPKGAAKVEVTLPGLDPVTVPVSR